MSRPEPNEPPAIGPVPDPSLETDDRFPSGEWTGFFLQPVMPGKHWMELMLTFRAGVVNGEGRDRVGKFRIRGKYKTDDGRCWWTKTYLGKHSMAYTGFNEGRGIWGTWEWPEDRRNCRGGFHIWPIGMADPTGSSRSAEADVPPADPEAPPLFEPSTTPVEAEPVTVSGELG